MSECFNLIDSLSPEQIHLSCATEDGKGKESLLNGGTLLPCGFHQPPIFITILLPSYDFLSFLFNYLFFVNNSFFFYRNNLKIFAVKFSPRSSTHCTKKLALYISSHSPKFTTTYTPSLDENEFRYSGSFDNLHVNFSFTFQVI